MTKNPLLIYLHGLNSAPSSEKAQLTAQYIDSHQLDMDCWIPLLPNAPIAIQRLLLNKLNTETTRRSIYIIGSSLGGYIGTWLMNHINDTMPFINTRLVLINPAVRPYELFEDYLGHQVNEYTGEEWELTPGYANDLKAFEAEIIHRPEDILLLVQTADKVLNYQKALDKYARSSTMIQEGGNHSFENYHATLPAIFEFLAKEPDY